MDFMNLNQAAHGDREAGFIHTRMRLHRKVVVGHWSDPEVQDRIGAWMRAARAWHDWQGAKFCRFGDNMRQVAVTEGDKVAAEMKFGFAINGYGVGDLVAGGRTRSPTRKSRRSARNTRSATRSRRSCARAARGTNRSRMARGIELGLRAFLEARRLQGLHDDLRRPARPEAAARPRAAAADGRGLRLRGRRRLEDRGAGARDEGHGRRPARAALRSWRTTPIISRRSGHQVLGAHMLEICPTIAAGKPSLEIHPLSHRRQGGSRPPGVRRAARPGAQRVPDGSRQPLPPARQRSDGGRPPSAAEAAGRPRRLGMQARLQDGVRGLDPRRRRAPHRLQLQRDPGNARGLRHHRRHRVGGDRRRKPRSRRSSRTSATTTSTITSRRGSAPDTRTG